MPRPKRETIRDNLFLTFLDTLKPPRHLTSSLAQNVLYAHVPFLSLNLSCMWVSDSLMYVGFPYMIIKFGYFLLLICLMSVWSLHQTKRTWRAEENISSPTLPGYSKLSVNSLSVLIWWSLFVSTGYVQSFYYAFIDGNVYVPLGKHTTLWTFKNKNGVIHIFM